MVKKYIPEQGDIVFLNFKPQTGRKQSGKRPAITLSPKTYNAKTGLGIFCPITSKIKGYPFEVALEDSSKIKGVILADHVKSLDFSERKAKYIQKTSEKTLKATKNLIKILLNI